MARFFTEVTKYENASIFCNSLHLVSMSFGLCVLAHPGMFTRDGLSHNRWPSPHPGELSLAHIISFAAGGAILAVSTVVEVPHVYRIFNIATLIQYTSRRKT